MLEDRLAKSRFFINSLCLLATILMPASLACTHMLHSFARILEVLFAVGVIGSLVVVALTFIEDIRDLGPDEQDSAQA